MNQKERIVHILKQLTPYRDMAEMFVKRIETGRADTKMLNQLDATLKKGITHAKSHKGREILVQAQAAIKQIRSNEDRESESKEADLLLDSI